MEVGVGGHADFQLGFVAFLASGEEFFILDIIFNLTDNIP